MWLLPLEPSEMYCIAAIAFSSAVLLLYHYKYDPDKRIERFYFKTSKIEYAIFRFAYVILITSAIMCVRHLIDGIVKRMKASYSART